ncbi:type IV secretory system conjugative DNA transfer family protein [Cellulomonas sp. 179-A 4D5 NHS]|uniref:type IV secretory system conjugative DNA transfer family protein n=1 Tax=Cellulomonas sp. 179-A 4D5 NHS TaxID=3142378 RepID=UPI0039A1DA36
MSSTSKTRGSGLEPETALLLGALGTLAGVAGLLWVAVHVGARIDGTTVTGDPFEVAFALVGGDQPWPKSATWVLAGLLLLAAVAGVVAYQMWRSTRRARSRVDGAAVHMGRGRDIDALSLAAVTATNTRLGGPTASPGLPIARTVAGGRTLFASWEDVAVDIWGPRTGKTTSRAIPTILAAPGAVLVTSNKRDVVDATRDPRAAAAGEEPWVFDPQGIVDEPATWWWNPLTYVVDEVKAAMLADLFATASRDPGARTDAYFDNAATDLLAGLLLAAAKDARPITDVYLWLTDSTNDEPVEILRAHDYPLTAAAVAGVIHAPEKQRGGVYGTAQQIASFLTNRQVTTWVTPTGGPHRREFVPAEFVRSSGTLYSLSKEGRGSAGPLVTALTVAVAEAAEEYAKTQPGGRLAVPMVAVLDEAANVCRWRELPNLYSHYGSRGICVLTILQSWSQGVEVWGRDGMRKLWSAATVKVYGGGVTEVEFLSELSQLIGEYERPTTSTSTSKQGRSTSRQTTRDRVLDVADLGALPKGRAIVLASGSRPTLVRTTPWMTGPHAAAVNASILAHDPVGTRTIADAASEVDRVSHLEDTVAR